YRKYGNQNVRVIINIDDGLVAKWLNLVEVKGLVSAKDFGEKGTLGIKNVAQIRCFGSPVEVGGLESLVGVKSLESLVGIKGFVKTN
ncbi:7517_t:CDS:2, partial [Gigaspora rosea]